MRVVILAVVVATVGLVLGVSLKSCQDQCANQDFYTKNCAMTPGARQ